MAARDPTAEALDESLKHWRQGDFALNVGGFLFADPSEADDPYDPRESAEGVVGLIVVTQTCDIVRCTGGRFFVAVCPLVERHDGEVKEIKKGRRPYLTEVENAPENVFADLRRIFSISKNLLKTWRREDGFSSEHKQLRFAAALERKFGRFAFPDEFDSAMAPFRKRVWSRHDKTGSNPGKVYRSLIQIRFKADPEWNAQAKIITMFAVLHEEANREIDRAAIGNELQENLGNIQLPDGYKWASPPFIVATPRELSAEDLLSSQRADFDFLCV